MNDKQFITTNTSIKECLKLLDIVATKTLFVINEDRKLIGAISDGDIRRALIRGDALENSIDEVYNSDPIFVNEGYQDTELRKFFIEKKIEIIPVVDLELNIVDVITWEGFFGNKVERETSVLDTPVVIMAGGKGTRMAPFTDVLPKPLIPIGQKTILEVIIDEYRKYSINDFYLTINYKGNLIEAYFNGIEKEYNIGYLKEKEFLGTASSLKLMESVPQTFIVSNCDIIVKADYADVLDFHRKSGSMLTILSSIQHQTIPYGVIEFSAGGRVTKINEKPEYSMPVNTGVYILEREAWEYIPHDTFFHMTHLIESLLKDGKTVMTYPVNENDYIDVGQWNEYRDVVKKMEF